MFNDVDAEPGYLHESRIVVVGQRRSDDDVHVIEDASRQVLGEPQVGAQGKMRPVFGRAGPEREHDSRVGFSWLRLPATRWLPAACRPVRPEASRWLLRTLP